MKSNELYHYLFKYLLLGISIMMAIAAVASRFTPESFTINGEPGSRSLMFTAFMSLFAVFVFLFFLLIKDKFVIVEMGNKTIRIKHLGEEEVVSWMDVEQVKLIQFVFPPLYKLKVKSWDGSVWFNTEPRYVSFNGFVTDRSDMGDLINKKKRELGI